MDIGRRGIENGLMPPVDRQRVGFGEVVERPIGVTESGREHRPCPSQPKQTGRERVGNGLAGEDRRRLGPAAESGERLRRERVEVAVESVEPGQLTLRDCVECRVRRRLVVTGVDERNAQVDVGEGARLCADCCGGEPTLDRVRRA